MVDRARFKLSDFEDPLSDYEPREYASELKRALVEDTVDEMQCRPLLQIRPTATIRQAVQTMAGSVTGSLMVVDEGRVIGIFTERDVLERVAEQFEKWANRPVSEVMTTDPTVVYETDPAAAAVAAIAIAGHRHVPVVGMDDRLVGVVSPRRVFDFIEKHDDA